MFFIIPQNHMVRSRKEHENFQSEIKPSIDVLPKYPACFPSDHCLSIESIIVASCSLFFSLSELVAYWIRFVMISTRNIWNRIVQLDENHLIFEAFMNMCMQEDFIWRIEGLLWTFDCPSNEWIMLSQLSWQ